MRTQRGGEVAFGEVEELDTRVTRKGVVVPVVRDDIARKAGNGGRDEIKHVGPDAESETARAGQRVQAVHVAGEVCGEAAIGDFGAATRASAEMERFIEPYVDFSRGAEWSGVA